MIQVKKFSLFRKAVLLITLHVSLVGCSAAQEKVDWDTACVGRMQFSAPKLDEIAVTPDHGGVEYAFSDGLVPYFSSLGYDTGSLRVSQPQSELALNAMLKAHTTQRLERSRKDYRNAKSPDGMGYSFEPIQIDMPQTSAWRFYGNRHSILTAKGNRLLSLTVDTRGDDKGSYSKQITNLVSAFRFRPILDLPKESGVCLPYAFVKDDGTPYRYILMTYRLKEHPDVQIMLMDASAARPTPGNRTKNAEPRPVMNGIWEQHLTTNKDVRSLWLPSTRTVKLAGFNGLESYVEITREDNSIDYGYLAVVRGNPDATEDTPDLRLFIIRDAATAKAKGKEPISKEAFLELAETVASSVRRRSVENTK